MSDEPNFKAGDRAVDAIKTAWSTFESAMNDDPDYAWAWHCNLAMPIMDSIGCSHEQANKAAAHLMGYLWKVDITTHPYFANPPAPPSNKCECTVCKEALANLRKAEICRCEPGDNFPCIFCRNTATTSNGGTVDRWAGVIELVERITAEEGASVTFTAANPDSNGLPNEAVTVVQGDAWQEVTYRADTLAECLREALAAKGSIAPIAPVDPSAGVEVTRADREAAAALELLRELRENIGAASLARNPIGMSIRDRVDIHLRAALGQPS